MTLEEFLLTADADHNVALQQARAYTETQGRFITSNSLTVYVVQLGLYSVFSDVAGTANHAARDICMAVIDRLRGVSDFNFISGTPMGDANFQLLSALKIALPDKVAELTQLEGLVTAYCNQNITPFSKTTKHDILIARDSVPSVALVLDAYGYVKIATNEDCENHNPRVLGLNPRTEKWQRVNNFYNVSKAGIYDAKVPVEFRSWQLNVDNAYEVIS